MFQVNYKYRQSFSKVPFIFNRNSWNVAFSYPSKHCFSQMMVPHLVRRKKATYSSSTIATVVDLFRLSFAIRIGYCTASLWYFTFRTFHREQGILVEYCFCNDCSSLLGKNAIHSFQKSHISSHLWPHSISNESVQHEDSLCHRSPSGIRRSGRSRRMWPTTSDRLRWWNKTWGYSRVGLPEVDSSLDRCACVCTQSYRRSRKHVRQRGECPCFCWECGCGGLWHRFPAVSFRNPAHWSRAPQVSLSKDIRPRHFQVWRRAQFVTDQFWSLPYSLGVHKWRSAAACTAF